MKQITPKTKQNQSHYNQKFVRCVTPNLVETKKKNRTAYNDKQNLDSVHYFTTRKDEPQNILVPQTQVNKNIKIFLDLVQYHKKQAEQLKNKNQQLSEKLKDQNGIVEKMRSEIKEVKNLLQSKEPHKQRETKMLKEMNQILQQKFLHQNRQMEELKSHFFVLKQELERKQLHNYQVELKKRYDDMIKHQKMQIQKKQLQSLKTNDDIQKNSVKDKSIQMSDQSQISKKLIVAQSLRGLYAANYEQNCHLKQMESFPSLDIESVCSNVCFECQKKADSFQQQRLRYTHRLQELEKIVYNYKKQEVLFEALNQQLKSKNQSIDYLVDQLSKFEINSKNILSIVVHLEQEIGNLKIQNQRLKTTHLLRDSNRYSIQTFNQHRY